MLKRTLTNAVWERTSLVSLNPFHREGGKKALKSAMDEDIGSFIKKYNRRNGTEQKVPIDV